MSKDQKCPNCGRCPTCGKADMYPRYPYYPYWAVPYRTYPQPGLPYTTWSGNQTSPQGQTLTSWQSNAANYVA